MSEWISVDERLPECEGTYLCRFSDGVIETFHYWDDEGDFAKLPGCVVTHWQPLPEPPK